MKYARSLLFFALVAVAIFSFTDAALAQTNSQGWLVPCGTGSDPTECQACHLSKLVQNVINFLILLSIPIAALLIAWAGFLYFTSGVSEKSGNISKAKQVLWDGMLGFLIAISAWLIIQTLLFTLLREDYYKGWNNIQCIQAADNTQGGRQTSSTLDKLLNSILPGLNIAPPVQSGTYACTQGGTLLNGVCVDSSGLKISDPTLVGSATCTVGTLSNGSCVDKNGNYIGAPTEVYTGTDRWAPQLAEACAKSTLADCAIARAIMIRECASGNPACLSPVGAAGLMQLMPETACGLDPTINGCSTHDYVAVRQVLTTNPQLNMELGTKELDRLFDKYNGDIESIAAGYNGGDKANNYSTVCGGGTAWQCLKNPGYTETRDYVKKVVFAYDQLKD